MTRKDLTNLGIESKEIIDSIMRIHGEDIENNKKKISDLETKIIEKDNSINELSDKIKSLDSKSEEIQLLKQKVSDYEKAEIERNNALREAEQDRIITENIKSVIGDKEFVNDFTKSSIINQIKQELQKTENSGKGAKDIFESLTNGVDNIFKEPSNKVIIPQAAGNQDIKKSEFKSFF